MTLRQTPYIVFGAQPPMYTRISIITHNKPTGQVKSMRLAIIAIALTIALLLAANQATGKEVAKAIVFPKPPLGFRIINSDNSTLFHATLFAGNGSIELLGVPGSSNITWYKVTPLSPSKFFSYTPILFAKDKVYVFGAIATTLEQIKQLRPTLLVGTLSLRELEGKTMLLELGIDNRTMGIIPVRSQVIRTSKGSHVLYLVADLVRSKPRGNNSSHEELGPAGFALLEIELERTRPSATIFPAHDIVVMAGYVKGDNKVYVAGIGSTTIPEMIQELKNITLVIGTLHNNVLSLHRYSVPGCDIPVTMIINNNVLYLVCMNAINSSIGLLAINPSTWHPLWARMYNISIISTESVLVGKHIYIPVMNGLLIVDSETGKPVKALVTAATPTEQVPPGLTAVRVERLGNKYYVVITSSGDETVTLLPLGLAEKAKCIKAGDIVLGEAKIIAKTIKPQLLGTETIQGRQVSVNTSPGPSLILTRYTNVSEKEIEISFPNKCKPQGNQALTITMSTTTRTVTMTTVITTITEKNNVTRQVTTKQPTIKTGPTTSYCDTSSVSSVRQSTTPKNKATVSATTSTLPQTSSTKAINHHGWRGVAAVAAIIVLAVVAVVALLVRRK